MSKSVAEATDSALPAPPLARDIVIVIAVTATSSVLAAYFEVSERLFLATRSWEHIQLDEWQPTLIVLAVCLLWLSSRRNRQVRMQLEARRAAEARLAQALADNRRLAEEHLRLQEADRKHLARELHDELGQYLNAIKIDALTVADFTTTTEAIHAAERIRTAVDHVYGVVSDMIRRLRPAGLDELGLVAALENCVDQWQARLRGVRIDLKTNGDLDGLDESTNLTVYRLVQESLTNCCKHSAAHHIDVRLQRSLGTTGREEIVLTVRDDGQGCDPSETSTGFGLSGMRVRAEMLGGHLSVASSPGQGFAFEAHLPLATK